MSLRRIPGSDGVLNSRSRAPIRGPIYGAYSTLRLKSKPRYEYNHLIGKYYITQGVGNNHTINEHQLNRMMGQYAWYIVYPKSKLPIQVYLHNVFIYLDTNNRIIGVFSY